MEPVSSTSRRDARAAYHNEYPQDFSLRIAFTVSFRYQSATDPMPALCRQGGREMSAPKPYETNPLRQPSSVHVLY